MDLGAAGLNQQPFRTHGRPLSIIPYASHRLALQTLRETCTLTNGAMLLQGPPLSGKTTLIRLFVDSLADEYSVAMVDGHGLNTTGLLETVLRQFGYVIEHSSNNELIGMLRVFVLHQSATHKAPVLIIENAHSLNPSALRVLGELAQLAVRGAAALKIILCADRSLRSLVNSPSLTGLAARITSDFHLRPMNSREAMEYLYGKLAAAGSETPEFIFPRSICTALWQSSGGWPGILDRLALLCLAKADTLPISIEHIERPVLPRGTWIETDDNAADTQSSSQGATPTMIVTHDGNTLQEVVFDRPRLLVGRSEHNDIAIPSKFISRHHALLVRHGSSTILMDLNSTNGTFVNSKRISNHMLIHDDVITVGNHHIKFRDPYAKNRRNLDGSAFADTVIMKTMEDMRRLLAQENTAILPTISENEPTSGL